MTRHIDADHQQSAKAREMQSLDLRFNNEVDPLPASSLLEEQPNHQDSFVYDDEDALVADLNERHAIIMTGGKSTYLLRTSDDLKFFNKQSMADFLAPYQLRVSTDKKTKIVPSFDVWLKSSRRRVYENGIVFEPNGNRPKALNLWQGFAVEPRVGNCELFKHHLLKIVCKGNMDYYDYLFGWLAQMVQDPARKPGTAVVLRGLKGTGKSTVSTWLKAMIGRHAKIAERPELFTGKFNSHLMDSLILLVEEGYWAGDKQAEGALKHLITGSEMMMERKGVDAVEVSSHVRLFMTTNNRWVVPATEDERRFYVLDVSSEKAKDHDYFSALDNEFNSGGPAAFLHELLEHDYSGVDLRNPPRTEALQEQIAQTLSAEVQWWQSVLEEGTFLDEDGTGLGGDNDWSYQLEIDKAAVFQSFTAYVKAPRGRAITTGVAGKFIREMVPNVIERRLGGKGRQDRPRVYVFPPLTELRASFTQRYGVVFDDPVADPAQDTTPKPITPTAFSSALH